MRSRVFHAGEPVADIEFCLVFPGEAVSVPVTRRVLGDTLIRIGMDENCVGDILLAVTEACSNAVRHAGPGRRYEVVAHVGSTRCLLEIADGERWPDADQARVSSALSRRSRPAARLRHPVARLRHPGTRIRQPAVGRFAAPRPVTRLFGRGSAGPATGLRGRKAPARLRWQHGGRAVAKLPESGRGMAIMRACVDDVSMRSRPGQGTVVSLQKRIEWRSDAPLARLPATQLRDAG